jgi:hypothetical protein
MVVCKPAYDVLTEFESFKAGMSEFRLCSTPDSFAHVVLKTYGGATLEVVR